MLLHSVIHRSYLLDTHWDLVGTELCKHFALNVLHLVLDGVFLLFIFGVFCKLKGICMFGR